MPIAEMLVFYSVCQKENTIILLIGIVIVLNKHDMVIPEMLDCNRLLVDKQLSLSLAESATAGHVTAAFSLTPMPGIF